MGKLPWLGAGWSGGRRNPWELVNQSWGWLCCAAEPCPAAGAPHLCTAQHEGGWQCRVEPHVEVLHFCQDHQVRGRL